MVIKNILPKYQIIDNFLDETSLNEMKELMLGKMFPWFYQENVTSEDKEEDAMYYTHVFYDNCKINSDFFDVTTPILNKLDIKALIRIKGNMYPNLNIKKQNQVHRDYDYQHKGAIFYLNTNNGQTVLQNQIKIDSIENRILLFNPYDLHYSNHCTDKKVRVNININYF